VFEHGPREVLRRYRSPHDTAREVAAMEHARAHGYPAPAARALSDTDIVMDRLAGPTMLADMMQRPWRIAHHAAMLAQLLDRLHAITGPAELPAPVGEGGHLLHLDLHPENVILTAEGPVVIDWANAARGPPLADVAHTWLVLACSMPPEGAVKQVVSRAGRRLFGALFLRHYSRPELVAQLRAVGAYRLARTQLPATELERIRRLVARTA